MSSQPIRSDDLLDYLRLFVNNCCNNQLYQSEKSMRNIMGVYLSLDEIKRLYKLVKEDKNVN